MYTRGSLAGMKLQGYRFSHDSISDVGTDGFGFDEVDVDAQQVMKV